ncbi:prolyl endopeptidase-like [Ptychodera flava]|uniref:prolyl endopeptidase-like n=1 Tax=Ptychodera flava TaxID=63121 RepID=UPI00396A3AF2
MALAAYTYVNNSFKRVLQLGFSNNRLYTVSMATSVNRKLQQTTVPVAAVANQAIRNSSSLVVPPLAKRQPNTIRVHGKEIKDNFAWLEDVRNKEVVQYITQETRYFQDTMKDSEQFLQKLMQEIATYDKPGVEKAPQVIDGYVYYDKTGNHSMPVHCRYKEGCQEEEVVVDLNILASAYGQPHINITTLKISPSHNMVAVVIETPENDIYDAQIWKIGKASQPIVRHDHHHSHSGSCCSHHVCAHSHGSHGDEKGQDDSQEQLDSEDDKDGNVNMQLEVLHNVLNVEWVSEDVLLYTSASNYIANQVWKHKVGTKVSQDELIYREHNDRFFVDISHTKDKNYITINSSSKSSSEVQLIKCGDPDTSPVLVQPRQDEMEYFIEHSNGVLYILTNKDRAHDYKLMKVSNTGELTMENWQDVYVPESNTNIIDMDVFDSLCVLLVKIQSVPALTVVPLQNPSDLKTIKLPDNMSSVQPEQNPDFHSTHYLLNASSPSMPVSQYKLDFKTSTLNAMPAETCNLDNNYKCERLLTTSKDGTEVPVTLFYKPELKLDGTNPMLIHGYGAYGDDLDVQFKPERSMLLNRGWVLAFAHVRGGSELGRHWYYQARQLGKERSFEDFEACLEHLHRLGYSESTRTAAYGVSAGGLLIASMCNRSPQLLKTAILKVPFVDVLNTMLRPSLPLTSPDFEEWGNPQEDSDIFNAIYSYCPYQNITNQNYPSMLVTASMNDIRVPFWMPLKYVAKRRHCMAESSVDQDPLVFQFDTTGTHYDSNSYEQAAMECAFLYKTLGMPLS